MRGIPNVVTGTRPLPPALAVVQPRVYSAEYVEALKARLRTCQLALNGRVEARPFALTLDAMPITPVLTIARILEESGKVPIVAFHRDAAGVIAGVVLSIALTPEESAATPAIEMTVVESDDEIPPLVPRGVVT